MQNFVKQRDIVLFFTPEAGVLPHFIHQCLIAKNLKHLGYTPVFTFCPALFCRCPVMDMHQVDFKSVEANKSLTCLDCATKFHKILDQYELPWLSLKDHLPENALQIAKDAVDACPKNKLEFYFENVPVGKIAFGDYAISTKSWVIDDFDESATEAWRQYSRSIIISYLAVKAICEKFPVKRVLRFNEYANNMGAFFAAKNKNIPVLTIAAPSHRGGVDLQRVVIFPKHWEVEFQEEVKTWPEWRELPLPPPMIREITTDIFERFAATSVFTYSPSKSTEVKDLRKQFGLTPGKKLLVAFTSSADERGFSKQLLDITGYTLPEQPNVFKDQIEWLSYLVEFVESRDDLELLVRVHPREGVNARYPKPSSHLGLLRQAFDKKFRSCHFIWPEEKVSSYDLLEIVDVGLSCWSTLGIEMARLGIPVVTAYKNISFPDDEFLEWGGPTPSDHIRIIREKLNWKPDLTMIAKAYRCYYKFRLGGSISFSDQIPSPNYRGVPDLSQVALEAPTLEEVIIKQKNLNTINLQLLRDLGPGAALLEKEALKSEVKRILWFLCTGTHRPEEVTLVIGKPGQQQSHNGLKIAYMFQNSDNIVTLISPTGNVRRYSPLACRLLRVIDPLVSAENAVHFSKTEEALSLLL